jgi:hypothetical protein
MPSNLPQDPVSQFKFLETRVRMPFLIRRGMLSVGFCSKDCHTPTKGFASMTLEKRRRLQSIGGKKAHQIGKAHKWTREEARFAGRLSQFIQGHTKDI